MTDQSSLLEALHGIASRIDAEMSEKDVENAFLNENFYTILGYSGAGHDLRSEWQLSDDRRPDYVTLDDNESVTAVYEFKTSGEGLTSHEDQLFHYVDALKADYGVLTNGEEMRLYKREGQRPMLTVSLAEATESNAADLAAALKKPEWDLTDPQSVQEYLDTLNPVELDDELGREHFFESFRLEADSPFADLVTAMVDLLQELRDEQEAKFVKGAYDFWEASYASEPDEVPESWDEFIDGKQSLRDFMFCLESGHALLARILLAKATDDHDFFPNEKGLRRYFDELSGFSDEISLDAYPIAANGMIEEMRNQLVESLFEDDIFIWWSDGYTEETASQHHNPYNRFKHVAKTGSDVSRVSQATRERFSRAVSEIIFSVLKFDFSRIEGDPLGNLYQRYFDPDTRKALGEFYTPQPVIDYIMDGVGYDVGVSEERIIDPSCGSGTFLVEAVERYIEDVERYEDDPDWADHLTELCTRPHVVGLDIHPFAVLMAQIRFMVTILPKYREAKQNTDDFTIRRLPIFRTDTLRNERELTGIDLGDDGMKQMTLDATTEDNQDVKIPVPLPVEVDEDEVAESDREGDFLVQRIRMPLFDTAKVNAEVRNFGEYFAALQGVLDVVKFHMHEEMWEYGGGLEEGINRYTDRDYDNIEDFFEPYVQDMLDTVQYLRVEHGDGRLFKMFEDTVLSLVVKNYMEYDYVVGNPPYVNIKHIPEQSQSIYEELYESAFGRYDLYVLFIERGLELLAEDGELGYIASNKFARSKYGQKIRKLVSESYSLREYIDFGDTGVFEDATNYPCLLFIDYETDRELVEYAKVHQPTNNVFDQIKQYLGQEEVITPSLEVSRYPIANLGENSWKFIPASVREVTSKIERNRNTTVGELTLGVRQGVSSGGDEAFIVSPEYAEQNDLEDELLLSIIRGGNVRRWSVEYEDELAIYPYDEDGELVDLSNYQNVRNHLDQQTDYLEDRYCVRKGNKGIYEYDGIRPKSVYEGDFKIATPDVSQENNFCHPMGYDCFKNTAYVLTFPNEVEYSQKELLAFLNSNVSEFLIKQSSPYVSGKYYRYKSQYVDPVALPKSKPEITEKVDRILELEQIKRTVEKFPRSYLDDFDGEIKSINYTWQTKRKPVDASIEEIEEGRFAITAGRTDEITDPLIDHGDSEENKLRAKYVHAAVDGRNMKKGEEQSIPIPRSRAGVEQLLDALEDDKQTVAETSIEELEAEIDRAVYDLFDLTADERAVIEEYLEVF